MKKFTRILALILALVLVAGLALTARAAEVEAPNGRSLDENELPPVSLGGEREMVGFEILNADDLPLIGFSRMSPNTPSMVYQWWDHVSSLQFLIHYNDGATAIKNYSELNVSASHNIVGPDSDENRITVTIGEHSVTYAPKFAETDVASIEILEEPTLVLGENENAAKLGEEKGIWNHWDAVYDGLKFRVNYTDGTSAVVNHEDLDRLPYDGEDVHDSVYNIPKYNGYNVNVQTYLENFGQGDGFSFWMGSSLNKDGVIPMAMLYKGVMVRFNVHVVENDETMILLQPWDQTAQYEDTAVFKVGVTGAGLQYQWQYRASAEDAWADCEGATASTLEVVADETVENFQYRCVITDGEGVVFYSDVATLTVEYPLYIENYNTYHINDLVLGTDGVYKTPDGFEVVIGLDVPLKWNGGSSLKEYVDAYGEDYFDLTHWDKLVMLMDENGFVPLTATTLEYLRTTTTGNPAWGESDDELGFYLFYSYDNPHDVKDGWVEENGKWAYYEEGEKLTDEWVLDGADWVYLGKDGYMVINGWAKDGQAWRYMNKYGRITYSKWIHDGYGWCYLNSKGAMDINKWVKDGAYWAYVGKDGYMVKNQWIQDGSQWCYIGKDGHMVTNGWAKDGSVWRWMNASGYITYDEWVHDGIGWCYINSKGYMDINLWVKDGGDWVYVGKDGYMVVSGWAKDGSVWRYLNKNGRITYSKWVHDGTEWCYINAKGYMDTNKWVKDGAYWAYVGKDGYMVRNQWVGKSYVDASGHALVGTHTIDGVKYTFDANGNLVG